MNCYVNANMARCNHLPSSVCVSLSPSLSLSLRLKGELAYNYKGPRTKDDIVEFTNRVSG